MGKYRKFLVHSFWVLNTVVAFLLGVELGTNSISENFVESYNQASERPKNTNDLSLSLRRTEINLPQDGKTITDKTNQLEVIPKGLAGRVKSPSSSVENKSIYDSPANRAPLSKAEIKSLVDLAVKSSDPIERRKAFDRILEEIKSESFTYEQAMNIRSAMHHGGANGEQWKTFDYAWGANDPVSAVAEIDNIPEQYRRGFTSNMLPGLASVEPKAAIGIVEAMDGEMRKQVD